MQSLYRPAHLTTAILELEEYWLDIIEIKDVRWLGKENLKTGNWDVFYSGSPRHQLGISLIVNDKILPRKKKLKAANEKIWYIEMECSSTGIN